MYGMVNQAVKDLVLKKFGFEAWEGVCKEAQISTDDFVFMDYYPDKITYDLVGAASKLLSVSAETVLNEFGKHWVQYTAKEGYGPIMDLFGQDFRTCLMNLNNLHARMGMTMPHLTPPRFVFRDMEEDVFELEYHSARKGLSPMVQGLIVGLAEKYGHQIKIDYSESDGGQRVFHIRILR